LFNAAVIVINDYRIIWGVIMKGPADIIFKNGKIITVDRDFTVAQAIAVRDGRIIGVGKNRDIIKLIDDETQVIDLKSRTILPGIIDSHFHFAAWALNQPPIALDVSCTQVKSIADIVSLVKDQAIQTPPGEWIRGFGWDISYLEECKSDKGRQPTRWDLDAVSQAHPVMLADFTGGHIFWVNSKALELANITKETPDPPGGQIIRDDTNGEPTGLFNEFTATRLIQKVIPPLPEDICKKAFLAGLDKLSKSGITSFTEPGIGPNTYLFGLAIGNDLIRLYTQLKDQGRLTARVSLLLAFSDWLTQGVLSVAGLRQYLNNVATGTGFGDNWLKIAGMKMGSDSMPLNKTSWMHEEYVGGGNGSLVMAGKTDEERYQQLVDMIVLASRHRFQVGVHATGDRAIDSVVDGFIKALEEDPWDARHYLIHGEYTSPDCAKRLAAYKLGVSSNSLIQHQIGEISIDLVGRERADYEWPHKTLIDSGVHLANSSDAPVVQPDWKMGIEAMITRESLASGQVCVPHERLNRIEAIRAHTIEGAWLDHADHLKGSLEVGKLADIIVLGKDIMEVDVHEIHNIPTLLTMVNGRIVYDSNLI
jgi:predicted amidohydrolase YtcJ